MTRITPNCPNGHGLMMYLGHTPWIVDGVPDIHNSSAQSIEYGCNQCGATLKIPTGDNPPTKLTPDPTEHRACAYCGAMNDVFVLVLNFFCSACGRENREPDEDKPYTPPARVLKRKGVHTIGEVGYTPFSKRRRQRE